MSTTPAQDKSFKSGNEFLPYHPQASHVSPAYRDGWNDCYRAARASLAAGAPLADAPEPTTDQLEALRRAASKVLGFGLVTESVRQLYFVVRESMPAVQQTVAVDAPIGWVQMNSNGETGVFSAGPKRPALWLQAFPVAALAGAPQHEPDTHAHAVPPDPMSTHCAHDLIRAPQPEPEDVSRQYIREQIARDMVPVYEALAPQPEREGAAPAEQTREGVNPASDTSFDKTLTDYANAAWHHDMAGMRAGYIRLRDLFATGQAPLQAKEQP